MNKHANWEMYGWASNCTSVLNKIQDASNTSRLVLTEKDKEMEKILGLYCLNFDDKLAFQVNFDKINPDLLVGQRTPTKKEFSAIIMLVFDSLGFLTQFAI